MILILTTLAVSPGYHYNENSSHNNLKPIYLRKLFSTKILCRYRSLEFTINLEPINNIRDEMNTNINQLEDICKNTKYNHICQYSIDEIKISATKLKNKLKLIESFQLKNSRKKRSIEEIVQKSITLSDYGYSDLKQGFEQVKYIAELYEKIKRETITHTDHINFISLCQLINNKIYKHIDNHNLILSILTDKTINNIISIIPIEMIKNELHSMEQSVNKEYCEFVIDLEHPQIISLLKLSKIHTEISWTNRLDIRIEIPTFYKSEFDLIKAIPIPFNFRNHTYEQRPLTEFTLVSYNKIKDDYHTIPFTLDEKRNCTSLNNKMICFPNNGFQVFTNVNNKIPEMLFSPAKDLCNTKDMQTLQEIDAIPLECNILRIPHLNKLIPLDHTIYYLYIVHPTTIKFDCPSMKATNNISKSIIITELKPECSVEFKDGYHIKRKTIYLNKISLQSAVFTTYAISKSDLIKKDLQKNYSINTLRNLQPDFSDLHEKMGNKVDIQPDKSSINTKIYFTFILLITIIITLWITTLYLIISFKKKIQQQIKKLTKDTPSEQFPNCLHCSFKFDTKPPLPPKTRSIPHTPLEAYDVPKFPAKKIEAAIVHYATATKKNTIKEPTAI